MCWFKHQAVDKHALLHSCMKISLFLSLTTLQKWLLLEFDTSSGFQTQKNRLAIRRFAFVCMHTSTHTRSIRKKSCYSFCVLSCAFIWISRCHADKSDMFTGTHQVQCAVKWTKQEFMQGMMRMGCDSLEKIKEKMPSLQVFVCMRSLVHAYEQATVMPATLNVLKKNLSLQKKN